jgi:putative hydrolase of the HAD superfamily
VVAGTAAVFFDVDFTLLEPGPRFQASGYFERCAEHGVEVDVCRFDEAVSVAAQVLDGAESTYDPELYIAFTRRIIELMGGAGPGVDIIARRLYDEWAEHQHFSLYDDVAETFDRLASRGLRLGLISNSHRCLTSFPVHFALDKWISVAVSSVEHGYMKPHPSIFSEALQRMGVAPAQAVMVGDSLSQDVRGARRVGMRAVWLARAGGVAPPPDDDVPVITTLRQLPDLV